MGVVEEVGSGVTQVKPGDRVVIPFVIACGEVFHCRLAEYAACETTNPGKGAALNQKGLLPPAALFRIQPSVWRRSRWPSRIRARAEGQRGPCIPWPMSEVLFLSDILPTGYQAALNAGVKPGSTVAIFGAGPVGLMSAACCRLLGSRDHLHGRPPSLPPGLCTPCLRRHPIDFKEMKTRPITSLPRPVGGA